MATTLLSILQSVKAFVGALQDQVPNPLEFTIGEDQYVIANDEKKASWKDILKETTKNYNGPDVRSAADGLKDWLAKPWGRRRSTPTDGPASTTLARSSTTVARSSATVASSAASSAASSPELADIGIEIMRKLTNLEQRVTARPAIENGPSDIEKMAIEHYIHMHKDQIHADAVARAAKKYMRNNMDDVKQQALNLYATDPKNEQAILEQAADDYAKNPDNKQAILRQAADDYAGDDDNEDTILQKAADDYAADDDNDDTILQKAADDYAAKPDNKQAILQQAADDYAANEDNEDTIIEKASVMMMMMGRKRARG